MRWFSISFFAAALMLTFSIQPIQAQTMTPTPTPQPGAKFWLDGPYQMGSSGTGQLVSEVFIPAIEGNPIVGWGFNNFRVTPSNYGSHQLLSGCISSPCLLSNSSAATYREDKSYCMAGATGIYRANCAALFTNYSENTRLSNTGGSPIWSGGFLSLLYNAAVPDPGRTWKLDAYVIRYGVPPLKADFTLRPQFGIAPLTVEFTNLSEPENYITQYAWDFGDGSCEANTCTSGAKNPPPHTYSECGMSYVVRLTITGQSNDTDFHEESVYVSCESVSLKRPLKKEDEDPDQMLFDSSAIKAAAEASLGQGFIFSPLLHMDNDVYTVHAVSKRPGAYVHSITSGVVESVKLLTWDQCAALGTVYPSGSDVIVNIEPNTPETPYCNSQLLNLDGDHTDPIYGFFKPFFLDVRDVYVVTIRVATNQKLVYVVKDAPKFLTVGDSVYPECVLGITIALVNIPTYSIDFLSNLINKANPYIVSVVTSAAGLAGGAAWEAIKSILQLTAYNSPEYTTENGIAFLSLIEHVEIETSTTILTYDDQVDLLSLISQSYPTEDNFCNSDPAHSDCLTRNSLMMNDGIGWQTSSSVIWNNPGVILGPNETIYQTLNLDPHTQYSLTAQLAPIVSAANATIRLFLGGTSINGVTLKPTMDNYFIPADFHDPDAGNFYTIGVQNTGRAPIEIHSICVTDGTPNIGPGGCYFNNPSFDMGLSGWTPSRPDISAFDGAVILEYGDSISQNVRLLPNGDETPHTYTVQVIYQGYFVDGQTPDPSGIEYIMQWQWPGDAGFEDFGPVHPDPRTLINASFHIEVTGQTEGLLTIRPNLTASNSSFQGIRIFELCMGGPFPGQESTGGEPPPFEPGCAVITRPQGSDVGAWTLYLWGNLNRFFQCDLKIILLRMYNLIREGITLFSWQARYWQAVAVTYARWIGTDLIPWLNGHFANIASGRTTTVVAESCNNIFCLFTNLIDSILVPITSTLLGIITQVTNLFLTLIQLFLSIFFALATRFFGSLNWLGGLVSIIVNAWNNATPQPIPGLPNCRGDPKSNMFCAALWVMENTIFSGPIGVLILPIILGIASIHLILWVIADVKKMLMEFGKAS